MPRWPAPAQSSWQAGGLPRHKLAGWGPAPAQAGRPGACPSTLQARGLPRHRCHRNKASFALHTAAAPEPCGAGNRTLAHEHKRAERQRRLHLNNQSNLLNTSTYLHHPITTLTYTILPSPFHNYHYLHHLYTRRITSILTKCYGH